MIGVYSVVEVIVIVRLERSGYSEWFKFRSVYASLMRRYPLVTVTKKVKGRVVEKWVAFLKRYEDIWESMFRLMGWKIAERHEVSEEDFRNFFTRLRELEEVIKKLRDEVTGKIFPKELMHELRPLVGLGGLTADKALNFLSKIKERFTEYLSIPKIIKGEKRPRNRFLMRVKTAELAALAVRGTNRDYLKEVLGRNLDALLSRGVIPLDYSLNYVIVAKKEYTERGKRKVLLSALDEDPTEVLKGLEARPGIVLLTSDKIGGLDFEERSKGWGLKIIETS